MVQPQPSGPGSDRPPRLTTGSDLSKVGWPPQKKDIRIKGHPDTVHENKPLPDYSGVPSLAGYPAGQTPAYHP